MDAQRIMIEYAVLGYIICPGNGGALLVASAAHEGDLEFINPGTRRVGFENIVRAVAIPAFRRQLFAAPGSLAMKAFVILSFYCLMALAATNGREGRIGFMRADNVM